MSEGPMQPDEPAFPETQDTLGLLASAALSADARARHLHAIRLRAAELGDAPVGAGASGREARPPLPATEPTGRGIGGLRWRGRRAAAVAGVWLGSLSLGTGVAAAAAMDDLPGQPLYGLKRAVETVQLHLPGDVQDDVRRRLELAARRLAEAEALRAQDADARLLVGVLGDAERLIDEAGRLAQGDDELTATVAVSASQARTRLTELLDGGLPEQAAQRAREAIEAATERAEERDEDGRGRGRGGDDDDADGTAGRSSEDDEDGDGRGRGRGRGGDDDEQETTSGSPPGQGDEDDPSPPEADDDDEGDDDEGDEDDDNGGPSGRGRSSADHDDDPDSDDGDNSGSGSGQGQGNGQVNGQGNGNANGGGNSGQGGGNGNSGNDD